MSNTNPRKYVNRELDRIARVFDILDKYPVRNVGTYRGHLIIDLQSNVEVSDEDKAALQKLDVNNDTIKVSWEIYI